MEFVDHARQGVARFGIEVVARAVQVRRHGGDEVVAELLAIGGSQLEAGNFRDGIPLVGGFEQAGQKRIFRDRLGREFRVNAGAPQEEQLLHTDRVRRFEHVVLDLEILEQEVDGFLTVGLDATHCRGRQNDLSRSRLLKESLDGGAIRQIHLGPCARDDFEVFAGGSSSFQRAHKGASE